MERVLITGINGFAASHLADYIIDNHPDVELHGSIRWNCNQDNISHIIDKINIHHCELTDYHSVRKTIDESKPDKIFHLAAQSYVGQSWSMPEIYFETNVIGTLNLLEALREYKLNPLIHISGSGEEYGLVYENEIPIDESNPLRPVNPYAVSKVAQGLLGYEHYKSYGQNIIRTRTFNHEGARRYNVFAIGSFAYQIVRIEKGLCEPIIKVGDLTAIREFIDVRDVARAYWLALEKGSVGELYCIGGDYNMRISDALNVLIDKSKIDCRVKIITDPARIRPTDVPLLISNSTKFRERTGWKPVYSFEQTTDSILNYWRQK